MRLVLLACFILLAPLFAHAHVPVMTEQGSLTDMTVIEKPEVSHAYYGELSGNPHTYVINAKRPFTLEAQLLVPDIPSATNNISGLVLRDLPQGRVEVVGELRAADASWERRFEFFGGDHYRTGPVFTGELSAGTYRIEVNTPDNIEQYVLVVGEEEKWGELSYLETIRRLAEVKVFFGKSQFAVIGSPVVYVPMGVLLVTGGGLWWFSRRRRVS